MLDYVETNGKSLWIILFMILIETGFNKIIFIIRKDIEDAFIGRRINMNYRLLKVYLNMWRIVPFYMLCIHCKFKDKVRLDIAMWKEKNKKLKEYSELFQFGYFSMNIIEFRNVMLNRLHRNKMSYVISRILFKPLDSLYINMPPEKIGGGLYFQHGFSTIVAAKEIGENCSINQQVTIGYNGENAPVIGNNVTITVGAIVIGDKFETKR